MRIQSVMTDAQLTACIERHVAGESIASIAADLGVPLPCAYAEYVRHRDSLPEAIRPVGIGDLPRDCRNRVPEAKRLAIMEDLALPIMRHDVARMHRVSFNTVCFIARQNHIPQHPELVEFHRRRQSRISDEERVMRERSLRERAMRREQRARDRELGELKNSTISKPLPMSTPAPTTAPRAMPPRTYPKGIDHLDLARRFARGEFDRQELTRRLRGHAPARRHHNEDASA